MAKDAGKTGVVIPPVDPFDFELISTGLAAAKTAWSEWKTSALRDYKITNSEVNTLFEINNIFLYPNLLIEIQNWLNAHNYLIVDDEIVEEDEEDSANTGTDEIITGDNIMATGNWASPSYGVGALLSDVDWANITANATMGYDPVTQQLFVMWDASSSGSGNAFVYSFRTQNWYRLTDASSQTTNMTNFAVGRNNILYVGGGSAGTNTSKLSDRTGLAAIDVITADLSFENVESLKNLTRVAVTYKGGTSTSVTLGVATNGTESFTTIGTLDSTSTSYTTETFSLTSDSTFQKKKSFQIRLNGNAASTFEIQDISLVYRNLGVRV